MSVDEGKFHEEMEGVDSNTQETQGRQKIGIKGWELFLVLYFLAIITFSMLFSIMLLWKPLETSPSNNTTKIEYSSKNQGSLLQSNTESPLLLGSEKIRQSTQTD